VDTKPVGVPSYMRLVRQGAGRSLELAWRTFAHPQPGKPVVLLAATTHIADEPFYRNLQATLDGHELVLYELLVARRHRGEKKPTRIERDTRERINAGSRSLPRGFDASTNAFPLRWRN